MSTADVLGSASIDDAVLEPHAGFTALTGETGDKVSVIAA